MWSWIFRRYSTRGTITTPQKLSGKNAFSGKIHGPRWLLDQDYFPTLRFCISKYKFHNWFIESDLIQPLIYSLLRIYLLCSYYVFTTAVSMWLTLEITDKMWGEKKMSTDSSLLLYVEQYILSHYILFVSLPFCSQYEQTRLILFPVKAWQLFCWFVWHYIWAALMQPRLLKDGLAEKKRQYALGRKGRVLEKRGIWKQYLCIYILLKALKIPA